MFILFYETPVKMEGLVFKDPLCPYLFLSQFVISLLPFTATTTILLLLF